MTRKIKQTIIVGIYFLILVIIIFVIFKLVFSPTCIDGKKNGDETGVDCGCSCPNQCTVNPDLKKIEVGEIKLLKDKNKYDFACKLINPNQNYGFNFISYRINLLNTGNQVVATKDGQTYLYPSDAVYVIETGISPSQEAKKAEFKITAVDWQPFKDSQKPEFVITDISSGYKKEPGNFFESISLITNKSGYDFYRVDLKALVRNPDGEIIAVNQANLNSIKSNEAREFRFFWPHEFEGEANKVEVQATANAFDLDNLNRP